MLLLLALRYTATFPARFQSCRAAGRLPAQHLAGRFRNASATSGAAAAAASGDGGDQATPSGSSPPSRSGARLCPSGGATASASLPGRSGHTLEGSPARMSRYIKSPQLVFGNVLRRLGGARTAVAIGAGAAAAVAMIAMSTARRRAEDALELQEQILGKKSAEVTELQKYNRLLQDTLKKRERALERNNDEIKELRSREKAREASGDAARTGAGTTLPAGAVVETSGSPPPPPPTMPKSSASAASAAAAVASTKTVPAKQSRSHTTSTESRREASQARRQKAIAGALAKARRLWVMASSIVGVCCFLFGLWIGASYWDSSREINGLCTAMRRAVASAGDLCVVCLEGVPTVALLSCGHLLCLDCAQDRADYFFMNGCPTCRGDVNAMIGFDVDAADG
eukprot:TRINITY_DN76110_c0_g1_i1.p1 TRINITY_DN76110_c0_g1~~TRINITY_DN76110_c0_g1_i1.p1  ORF type:complete len:398 (+),score=61.63 TRINITY_DN76110_c0_g1_i1:40-1233(+)